MLGRRSSVRMVVALAAVGLVGLPAATAAANRGAEPPGKPVTVMTRNVYLGADIQRPVQAIQSATDEQDLLVKLANATHETRAIVERTDFPRRAELLADEIGRTRPHLVGLQEVALWRSGPLQLDKPAVPNAAEVDYDYLRTLLDALDDRGLQYEPVSVSEQSDVEAPSFTGSPFDGSISTDARDVRLTVRDVVLMRRGSGLSVQDSGAGHFTHNLSIDVTGTTLDFTRGYNWVDVRAGSEEFRFVNTHLEAFSSDLAHAQAAELLAGPADHGGSTIVVCDCNSDPFDDTVKGPPVNDTRPHSAAYDLLTKQGGFTDLWLDWAPASEGWTSGLNETVDEPTPSFTHRIDLILARTADGSVLSVDRGTITGNELSDKDAETGLWPSDHAGVVLRLRGPLS